MPPYGRCGEADEGDGVGLCNVLQERETTFSALVVVI